MPKVMSVSPAFVAHIPVKLWPRVLKTAAKFDGQTGRGFVCSVNEVVVNHFTLLKKSSPQRVATAVDWDHYSRLCENYSMCGEMRDELLDPRSQYGIALNSAFERLNHEGDFPLTSVFMVGTIRFREGRSHKVLKKIELVEFMPNSNEGLPNEGRGRYRLTRIAVEKSALSRQMNAIQAEMDAMQADGSHRNHRHPKRYEKLA